MSDRISNNLRSYRERLDLQQIEVAKLMGFASSDRISRWEHGQAFPSVVNLFKLAKLYDVLPHQLYEELWSEISVKVFHSPNAFGNIPTEERGESPYSA